jgi:uncharacterized protein (DUF2344 family)
MSDPIRDDLRKWRRTDDLDGLRMRIQRAMRTAEVIMYAEGVEPSTRLSAARAVVSAAREARKTIEAGEMAERIEVLEDALRQEIEFSQDHTNGHAKHR